MVDKYSAPAFTIGSRAKGISRLPQMTQKIPFTQAQEPTIPSPFSTPIKPASNNPQHTESVMESASEAMPLKSQGQALTKESWYAISLFRMSTSQAPKYPPPMSKTN